MLIRVHYAVTDPACGIRFWGGFAHTHAQVGPKQTPSRVEHLSVEGGTALRQPPCANQKRNTVRIAAVKILPGPSQHPFA